MEFNFRAILKAIWNLILAMIDDIAGVEAE